MHFVQVAKCTYRYYGGSGTIQNADGQCILSLNIIRYRVVLTYRNFPMNPYIRLLVGLLIGWLVCHNFLIEREVTGQCYYGSSCFRPCKAGNILYFFLYQSIPAVTISLLSENRSSEHFSLTVLIKTQALS